MSMLFNSLLNRPRFGRSLLVGLVLMTGLTIGFTTNDSTDASPCFEIDRTYYSDASHTTIVGGVFWPCSGPREQWGEYTIFFETRSERCPGCYA